MAEPWLADYPIDTHGMGEPGLTDYPNAPTLHGRTMAN